METLSGSVERITYYNAENGYSVVRLRPDRRIPATDREGLVTLTGSLPEVNPGEHLSLTGQWNHNAKYGLQFNVETCQQTLPATASGIQRYLGSGLVKGLGPRLAERIVARFGVETLDVIEQTPERLLEVPDIGPKRTRLIAAAWAEQKQVKEIMLFLHSYGVHTHLAVKIYKTYADQSLEIVRNDPYRLARDIYGVGFKTADKIAQSLGLAKDHPSRIEAALVYVLNQMSDEGHVFAPRAELVEKTVELLGLEPALIQPGVERLVKDGRVFLELVPSDLSQPERNSSKAKLEEQRAVYGVDAVYLAPFYHSEIGVAERIATLYHTRTPGLITQPSLLAQPGSAMLSDEQRHAVELALSNPVSILTGGPGTGKTTTLKALIETVEAAGKRYALASPTGRAAKRMAEATGRPASTLHRLLGFAPGEGYKFNADNPLPVDLLVVDEASMLDLLLTYTLLKALRPGTHLLLVGDVDQLPSVGAGDVLRDLIESGLAPLTRLSQIFRQAAESHIISNAHRINQGQAPLMPRDSRDFFVFPAETAEEAADWVQQVVSQRIPARFGLDPLREIQVLAPMYRGPAGVHALNEALQAALNPPAANKPEKRLYGINFRLGDKLMQTQNNYDKDVYNGDIGWLVGLDLVEQQLIVSIDGQAVGYDFSEADQLAQAYAVSVHKAQGSEFPAVVIPLVTAHYMMLQRNLLYTAVTRARGLCVLVGSQRAIQLAVHNNKVTRRYSGLDWRLKSSGERG